jgi:hypothetical protein
VKTAKRHCLVIFVLLFVGLITFGGGCRALSTGIGGARRVVNLDGTWELAEGGMDSVPVEYEHEVPVPGLVDMAKPAFAEVGKNSPMRQAFWYRRTFTVEGQIPAVAILKIHKAKYGTKVFLNGRLVGEHLPCFTPALLDVRQWLKGSGRENELVIRIGAHRELLPQDMPTGWDFEKYLYIPGIYDSVELILAGSPYIANVQTVPDIDKSKVRVIAEIDNVRGSDRIEIHYKLSQVRVPKTVYRGVADVTGCSNDKKVTVDFEVPVPDCRLWTPEDPFLYELELGTAGDYRRVRFGMRSLRFDPKTKRAILNGKPYFMRGTNVCLYRFFEDAERGNKPWRKEWVRRLHRKFKTMHWNSIRYCIGFPPEFWYDIADEEGFLIQDEFPIWLLGEAPEDPKAEKIIPEYIEWMRERWNHACVVIWDGQNESVTPETGKAIQAVRHLDFSNRPWENGWAEPQNPNDCVESHPYRFSNAFFGKEPFYFKDIAGVSPVPKLHDAQKKHNVSIIINEYAWLWLDRDGIVTCLTDKVYDSLLGPNSTVDQRRQLYAKYLAGLTEFWRCHRKAAGVLHFCSLSYSRAGDKPRPEGGATSDHFLDVETVEFEPHFEKYVRDAFSPVALMIDFWDQELAGGTDGRFEVFIINDLYSDWEGDVHLRIERGSKVVGESSKRCKVAGLGREVLTFELVIPDEPGEYQLVAELLSNEGKVVRSLRDFKVVTCEQ